jgi:DNA-binding NtrC family response regulator
VSSDGPVITVKSLPNAPGSEVRPMAEATDDPDAIVLHLGTTLEDAEREVLLRTLASTSNNKTRAAEILGCTPKTLHNKLQRYAARTGSGV